MYPWEWGKLKPTKENYLIIKVYYQVKRECQSFPKEMQFSMKQEVKTLNRLIED